MEAVPDMKNIADICSLSLEVQRLITHTDLNRIYLFPNTVLIFSMCISVKPLQKMNKLLIIIHIFFNILS